MMTMAPGGYPHMPQHPGAPPGHPMAPGMAHNPSQPGTQAGAIPQHLVAHMGVSAAGGQMNPAAMMGGLPPGGNPNAHAMQHLNPQQMFQQQHMNPMFQTNILQQQMNQQRMQQMQQQQQQHARQQLMAQQYQNMGGMQMAMPMQGMNQQAAAQYAAAMRARLPVGAQGMNPQQQAMVAQQLAIQQQQQQMSSQMSQQGGNPNQQHMTPHAAQLQHMQQAQLAALQAQQAAAQQAQAQAQAQQGQAQQPQQAQPQPSGPQQSNPQQQPGPSGGGANGVPQNQGPTQGPTPQPNPQQQPQAPQTPQQTQVQQTQAQMAAAAHQQAAVVAANSLQQQKREGMKGHCLLKLMQFGEHLSGYSATLKDGSAHSLNYWNAFVQTFFSPNATFRYGIHEIEGDEQSEKQFEIAYPALPRYFYTHFDSGGVVNMQLSLEKGTTDRALPGDCHFIENSKASITYWFDKGSHVVATGTLRAKFDAEQKFELFEFLTQGFEEFVSRKMVINGATAQHEWNKEWHNLNNPDNKQSPEMSKKGKAKPLKSPQSAPPDLDIPGSVVLKSGITNAVNQFLEITEIIGTMTPLFGYYHSHPGVSPYAALEQYVSQLNASGQNMNGQGMPPGTGPRTPGFNQFPTASPAMTNQMLPGSPHVGSPAPGQMQAPGMQLQPSQQGTSSSGPSANTSPSQNNKKRRASAVKNEDDTPGSAPTPVAAGTPQINGIGKAKPPTPSMAKRIKGNPV